MDTAKVKILFDEPVGRIHADLFGQFAEHLGRCIYDGIWVGEDSSVPNDCGFRLDVVKALRRLRLPVVRWPGGCFADDYHWQDGIGPRENRPRRINIHWGGVIETNAVGTHEFIHFCRLIGAKPYFCGNVGSGTPREMRDWAEYCNFAGDSSWARLRAENGSPEPLGVEWWAVGNENWGCGGNFSPEDYCTEFRRFASFLPGFGRKLKLVACGPAGNDLTWTNRFFEKLRKDYWDFHNIHAFAAHFYCGLNTPATGFDAQEWYRHLANAARMEPLVIDQREALDQWDPQRQIGLIVDEWGTWHQSEPGTNPAFLYQQNTMRDAAVAALTLDIFQRHADKVVMANIAQMVNVLQALILTEEGAGRMLKTPTYHVYDMYRHHMEGESIRIDVDSPGFSAVLNGQQVDQQLVNSSASRKDDWVTLSLTNLHADEGIDVRIMGAGAAGTAEARVLHGAGIQDHNTFDEPDRVQLAPLDVARDSAGLRVQMPPASVAVLRWQA